MKRKVLSGVLAMAMVLGMTASVGSVQVKADDEITLKVFSNLPDRKNEQAAMFYMGSWEASMALNEDIPEDIRTNIRVFTMPEIDGGQGKATDIAAWNGGGYAIEKWNRSHAGGKKSRA